MRSNGRRIFGSTASTSSVSRAFSTDLPSPWKTIASPTVSSASSRLASWKAGSLRWSTPNRMTLSGLSRWERRHAVKNKATSPQSQSDWDRVDRMKDEDIDLSGLPEIPPEKFARAIVRKGLQPVARKAQITLRVDADVLEWFREKGAGYQSRMNAVLRAYKQA